MTSATTTADLASQRRNDGTAFLGMVIFMASWAMLFASLFFAYGVVRAGAHVWPPTDLPRIPRLVPSVATAVLALSSWALQGAYQGARAAARTRTVAGRIAISAGLGALFLVLQITVWRQLYLAGLRPASGTYASAFYGLTVFHALHVVVGLVALTYLSVRAHAFGPARHTALRLWTLYWHMVGIIWATTFMLVYLL